MNDHVIRDTYQLNWQGPFVLKGTREKLLFDSPEANKSGIYIYAVEYRNAYMIYNVGMTNRTFKVRLNEEIGYYQRGEWTILNTKGFPTGNRDEIWHGIEWTGKKKEPERRMEFESRRQELNPEIENLLSTFRIFVAPLEAERRVLARIESAMMKTLYSSEEPFRSFRIRIWILLLQRQTNSYLQSRVLQASIFMDCLNLLKHSWTDMMHGSVALPNDLQEFIDSSQWTIAKTMPEWPHEYIVRKRVDENLFVQLVHHIRANGYEGKFYQKIITYYDDGGLVYWTMGAPVEETTIVNRCKREDTYEYRLLKGTLPEPKNIAAEQAGPESTQSLKQSHFNAKSEE